MDHKSRPYEEVRLSPSVKRYRVDNGWLYQIKTSESTPPFSKPSKPTGGDLSPADWKDYHEELSEYDSKVAAFVPVEYWSTPVAIPDRPSLRDEHDRINSLDETVRRHAARIDALTPKLNVRNVREMSDAEWFGREWAGARLLGSRFASLRRRVFEACKAFAREVTR